MNCALEGKKLELSYPCNWEYKLVGNSHEEISKAVSEILSDKKYSLESSKSSKKGNYHSFNLKLTVENEDERITFYELFGKHKAIKIVL